MYYPRLSSYVDPYILLTDKEDLYDTSMASKADILTFSTAGKGAMSTPRAPPGHFTLLYFAAATAYTRKQHEFFSAPLATGQLSDLLEQRYPGMKEKVLVSCAVTVNLDYVDLEEEAAKGEGQLLIQEMDEVAIIPPVSSG